jgi:flagellum-specific peptidoglycan hydrolase FlgJ
LALSQLVLEGGIRNGNTNSRPIRTKNPFNVGNVDSGSNVYHSDVQSSINTYYNLIAKNYLGKGKTAKDLITNFVNRSGNRYATSPNYESGLNRIAAQANSVARPVIARLGIETGTDTSMMA